ncbi:MAG: hypothetical protein ACYC27_02320 [Armatimonadota bacterium]
MKLITNTIIFSLVMICASSAFTDTEKSRVLFIENNNIKVGVDLAIGGAVTYASKVGDENIINSYDWGRQIQQSYYSGPENYTREGKEKSPNWAWFCWNPIQSGDSYNNGSKVIDYKKTRNSLYVKTIPMLWPMKDDPGECYFETWITLKDSTFKWKARLTNNRKDASFYGAHSQEVPAVYTNGPWHRLISYTGDEPFTGDGLTEIRNDHHEAWPWTRFLATERWAALVNDLDEGIGVWHPTATEYHGGFAGRRGKGGPKDAPTGYMSPIRQEILDHNIVYDYECVFIIGNLQEIRSYATHHTPPKLPQWSFKKSRDGWTYENVIDSGWPVKDGLNLRQNGPGRGRIISSYKLWHAESAPYAAILATVDSDIKGDSRLYWREMPDKLQLIGKDWNEWAQGWRVKERSVPVPLTTDGKERWYVVKLSDSPAYTGGLIGLALELPEMTSNTGIRIKEVRLINEKEAVRLNKY